MRANQARVTHVLRPGDHHAYSRDAAPVPKVPRTGLEEASRTTGAVSWPLHSVVDTAQSVPGKGVQEALLD